MPNTGTFLFLFCVALSHVLHRCIFTFTFTVITNSEILRCNANKKSQDEHTHIIYETQYSHAQHRNTVIFSAHIQFQKGATFNTEHSSFSLSPILPLKLVTLTLDIQQMPVCFKQQLLLKSNVSHTTTFFVQNNTSVRKKPFNWGRGRNCSVIFQKHFLDGWVLMEYINGCRFVFQKLDALHVQ